MGIYQLTKVLEKFAPGSIQSTTAARYANQRLAIDASLYIYQFLFAIRTDGATLGITTDTSHLIGFFYRTIKLVELGISVIYVFDGPSPLLKLDELKRRSELRRIAEIKYEEARLSEDKAKMEMYDKRKTKMMKKHTEDVQRLLTLMGIPWAVAPGEGEAYCAWLCRLNHVDAVVTDDMDALTFGAPKLLKKFNSKEPKEINLKRALELMGMTMKEFTQLCILLGCDYCDGLKGAGPQKAFRLIREHGSIEQILERDPGLKNVPENWKYKEATEAFMENFGDIKSDIKIDIKIKWDQINLEKVQEFLVGENDFNLERVNRGMARLMATRGRGRQMRIEGFLKKRSD